MGKSSNGKLSKLRCIIKRWNSCSRLTPAAPSFGGGTSSIFELPVAAAATWRSVSFSGGDEVPAGLHPVYVGKSRRRYLVREELVGHPLFRVLADRSGGVGGPGGAGVTVVGCEVVLFEHLLWMLENADPHPDSLDELVEFYSGD